MQVSVQVTYDKRGRGLGVLLWKDNLAAQLKLLPIPQSVKQTITKLWPNIKKQPLSECVVPVSLGKLEVISIVILGASKQASQWHIERAFRLCVRSLKARGSKRIAIAFPSWGQQARLYELAAYHAVLASYDFSKYKSKKIAPLQAIGLLVTGKQTANVVTELRASVRFGCIVAEETNNARDLSNTPGADMTPDVLARHAKKDASRAGFTATIFDEKKIESLGMGGVMGVSRGSAERPRFIVCEWKPSQTVNSKPIVLVGKGVTFDTGGLNLKPDMSMYEMHLDMSGGSAVLHTVAACARLRLPLHVVALIPAVENMPGSSGYRPGDVLKTISGKTIEVKNTDAEGRIVLADALGYAKRLQPACVIDVATLTGAAMGALGQRASALFSSDDALLKELQSAGDYFGDRAWPLPLWEEYKSEVQGDFGDVSNLGKTRYGGAITAAAFLWEFAPITSWAHIDIAPTMTTIEDDRLAKGAKGAGVPLLVAFLRTYASRRTEKK